MDSATATGEFALSARVIRVVGSSKHCNYVLSEYTEERSIGSIEFLIFSLARMARAMSRADEPPSMAGDCAPGVPAPAMMDSFARLYDLHADGAFSAISVEDEGSAALLMTLESTS